MGDIPSSPYITWMPNGDKHGRHRDALSEHPYPLLRVHNANALLSVLEKQLSAATTWRLAKNHADHRAVVADYIGDSFSGEKLGVAVYDLEFDQPTPSNVLSFAVLAHRWFRAGKEVMFVSDDDIASAFNLFLPIVCAAIRECGLRCGVKFPKPRKTKPLASGVVQQLTSFIRLANLAVLHPFDWERFFRFVRYCHAHHVSLGQERLRSELVARGVTAKLADKLALCYANGRGVLSCSFEWVE